MANTPIGSMRTRLRIDQAVATTDSQGGRSVTYTPRCEVWGKVEVTQARGREDLTVAQIMSQLLTTITIWWRDDVSVTDRVVLTNPDRTLEIQNCIDPDGMRDYLRLLCAEVQA